MKVKVEVQVKRSKLWEAIDFITKQNYRLHRIERDILIPAYYVTFISKGKIEEIIEVLKQLGERDLIADLIRVEYW